MAHRMCVASTAWRYVEAARWQRFACLGAIGPQREAPLCLRAPDAAAVMESAARREGRGRKRGPRGSWSRPRRLLPSAEGRRCSSRDGLAATSDTRGVAGHPRAPDHDRCGCWLVAGAAPPQQHDHGLRPEQRLQQRLQQRPEQRLQQPREHAGGAQPGGGKGRN